MPVVRGVVVGLVGAALLIGVVACSPAPATGGSPGPGRQPLPAVSGMAARQELDAVVWGRVPYCDCLAGSATANVAGALKEADVNASLKELSPRDGWLYFAVTFDPASATEAQVGAAIEAGGAEVIEGPP